MNKQLTEKRKNLEAGLKRITDNIIREYSPSKIILFGSLADGDIYEDSDIDLMVIKSTDDDPWERALAIDKIIDHKVPVDILVYTPEEIEQRLSMNDYFVKDCCERGRVLYNA